MTANLKRLSVLVFSLLLCLSLANGRPATKGNLESWLRGKKPPSAGPESKYFHEYPSHSHYDIRFTRRFLSDADQQAAIKVLVQTYLATFRDLGIQTWLMHGTLLGWWWGRRVMPFDEDADMQVTEADLYFLAAYHNMTTYYYKYGDMEEGRFFLLDVNPHFVHREWDQRQNKIDARWIDMHTGLYIDITAARYNLNYVTKEGMFYDKNYHEYRDTYVFPLRDTTFEGVPAKIPFRYKEMLMSEYGEEALVETEFKDYTFDTNKMEWVPSAD